MVTTIHGFSSESDRAGVPALRRHRPLRRRSATPTAARCSTTPPQSTTASTPTVFTFAAEPGDYLLFLGRIHPDKGTHRADRGRSPRPDVPLVIAGIVQDADYFATGAPHVDGWRSAISGRSDRPNATPCSAGRALLHLINFDEPFGLSVVEALATGTPMIATPARVDAGDMSSRESPASSSPTPRRRCTPWPGSGRSTARAMPRDAETRFSAERMVDDYLVAVRADPPRPCDTWCPRPRPRQIRRKTSELLVPCPCPHTSDRTDGWCLYLVLTHEADAILDR